MCDSSSSTVDHTETHHCVLQQFQYCRPHRDTSLCHSSSSPSDHIQTQNCVSAFPVSQVSNRQTIHHFRPSFHLVHSICPALYYGRLTSLCATVNESDFPGNQLMFDVYFYSRADKGVTLISQDI